MDFWVCGYYGRFLSINKASAMPTMMITIIMATIPGRMYMSAADAGVGVGAEVAAGSEFTVKPDSE